jgi:hypothetical protein
MTQPNPVRTLESHGVIDQTGDDGKDWSTCPNYDGAEHQMRSINTNSRYVQYVEQCSTCLWIDPASLTWWAENAIKVSIGERAQRIAISTTTEPFAFAQPRSEDLDLDEILGQALGAASMCWVGGTGDREFDSSRARAIWEALKREVGRFSSIEHKEVQDLMHEQYLLLCDSSPEESSSADQRHLWHAKFQNLNDEFHRLSGNNPGRATVKADATTAQEESCTPQSTDGRP